MSRTTSNGRGASHRSAPDPRNFAEPRSARYIPVPTEPSIGDQAGSSPSLCSPVGHDLPVGEARPQPAMSACEASGRDAYRVGHLPSPGQSPPNASTGRSGTMRSPTRRTEGRLSPRPPSRSDISNEARRPPGQGVTMAKSGSGASSTPTSRPRTRRRRRGSSPSSCPRTGQAGRHAVVRMTRRRRRRTPRDGRARRCAGRAGRSSRRPQDDPDGKVSSHARGPSTRIAIASNTWAGVSAARKSADRRGGRPEARRGGARSRRRGKTLRQVPFSAPNPSCSRASAWRASPPRCRARRRRGG